MRALGALTVYRAPRVSKFCNSSDPCNKNIELTMHGPEKFTLKILLEATPLKREYVWRLKIQG